MSRIGKKTIAIPTGVEVKISGSVITVKGPKGTLEMAVHPTVSIAVSENKVSVSALDKSDREQKKFWGTTRSLVNNLIKGVSEGFVKKLDIVGVGYRAAIAGDKLTLNLGYSHPIDLPVPQGLEVKVEKNTITISGIDKQVVGQFAAIIRSQRPPEPYKGKGIKYSDEVVRRKAGKVVKAVGGG